MSLGIKYRIIYDSNGKYMGKVAVKLPVAVEEISTILFERKVQSILPPLKVVKPEGHSRGYGLAMDMVKDGIKNRDKIWQAVYDFYKANTNRTDNRIRKEAGSIIDNLIKNRII